MDFSQAYVQANDLQVFYHRVGRRDNPPLLLLHGFGDNGLCWIRVAQDLQDQYNVIMPDARGHGRTQGDVDHFSYEQLGADALAFVEALGLERPFLFGHSMGAQTALIVAALAPDLVRAMVLEDPPFDHAASQDPAVLQKIADEARDFQERPFAEKLAAIRANNPGWAEEEFGPWAESKEEYNPQIQSPPNRIRMHQFAWRPTAANVTCPVLLVTAGPGKGIVTPEVAVEATELMPHCATIQIPDAGHCIHRDAYAATMQPVTKFLASH